MNNYKILIVEDDFDTRNFLSIFLSRRFAVDVARSSDECFEFLEKGMYNLILMDIAIKGSKDGLQITKELKNSEKYSSIPVICLSAHVMQKDKENALKAGVDLFLEKPTRNSVLLENILKFLNLKNKN